MPLLMHPNGDGLATALRLVGADFSILRIQGTSIDTSKSHPVCQRRVYEYLRIAIFQLLTLLISISP